MSAIAKTAIAVLAAAMIAFYMTATHCDLKILMGLPSEGCPLAKKGQEVSEVTRWLKSNGGGMCVPPRMDITPDDSMRMQQKRKEGRA